MKKKTKIALSCLSIVLSLSVLSVGITFAWTATSGKNYINSIEIGMKTERNLEISDTRGDFRESLDYTVTTLKENLYQPLSSYSFRWMNDEYLSSKPREEYDLVDPCFYGGYSGINNTSIPYEPEITELERGYFSRHLYLSCDDNVYVTIDPDKFTLTPNTNQNKKWAQEIAEDKSFPTEKEKQEFIQKKTDELNGVSNSLRVSILYKDEEGNYRYFIINPNKTEETYFLGILNSSTTPYFDTYYQQNQSYEAVYGYIRDDNDRIIQAAESSDLKDYYLPIQDEDILYNIDESHPATGIDDTTSFNSYTKKGTHHFDIGRFQKDHKPVKEDSYTPEELRPIGVKRESPIMIPVYKNTNDSSYRPTEIVLSIYMEGWDRNCINETMGASFSANLSFMIARESGK